MSVIHSPVPLPNLLPSYQRSLIGWSTMVRSRVGPRRFLRFLLEARFLLTQRHLRGSTPTSTAFSPRSDLPWSPLGIIGARAQGEEESKRQEELPQRWEHTWNVFHVRVSVDYPFLSNHTAPESPHEFQAVPYGPQPPALNLWEVHGESIALLSMGGCQSSLKSAMPI